MFPTSNLKLANLTKVFIESIAMETTEKSSSNNFAAECGQLQLRERGTKQYPIVKYLSLPPGPRLEAGCWLVVEAAWWRWRMPATGVCPLELNTNICEVCSFSSRFKSVNLLRPYAMLDGQIKV